MIYFCWVGEPQLQIYQGVFILSIAKAFFPLAEPVVVLRKQKSAENGGFFCFIEAPAQVLRARLRFRPYHLQRYKNIRPRSGCSRRAQAARRSGFPRLSP